MKLRDYMKKVALFVEPVIIFMLIMIIKLVNFAEFYAVNTITV